MSDINIILISAAFIKTSKVQIILNINRKEGLLFGNNY